MTETPRHWIIPWLLALLLALAGSSGAMAVETVTYYHTDALGSPIAATDETGQVLWREAYLPYGERILEEDFGGNRLGYTGKAEEGVFGLSDFGARWYAPGTGRFLSPDPVGFDEGNPLSFNRYAYGNDNPYSFIDPDGRESIDVQFAGMDGGQASRKDLVVGTIGTAIPAAMPFLLHPAVASFVVKEGLSEATGIDLVSLKGLIKSITKVFRRVPKKTRTKKVEPVQEAEGPHTTWKTDPQTGEITRHETWTPNPRNPTGWGKVQSTDLKGTPHFNKRTGESVPTPHTQGKNIPGGVRPARPDEIPKRKR